MDLIRPPKRQASREVDLADCQQTFPCAPGAKFGVRRQRRRFGCSTLTESLILLAASPRIQSGVAAAALQKHSRLP